MRLPTNAPQDFGSASAVLHILVGAVFAGLALFLRIADMYGFRFWQLLPQSWFGPVTIFAITAGIGVIGVGIVELRRNARLRHLAQGGRP